MKDKAIGVIDSGIGGLTVMREILRQLPNEKIVYVGDDVHSPYGERTAEDIVQLSLKLISSDELSNIKALVIACNSITVYALDEIIKNSTVPVIGVVEAGVQAIVDSTKNKKIGVLATNATVNSGVYKDKILSFISDAAVTSVPAPKLHMMAQDHLDKIVCNPSQEVKDLVLEHVQAFMDAGCDTVLMGCTHFPPYKDIINEIMGPDVNVVDPSYYTALNLKKSLEENNTASDSQGSYKIISTAGNDEKFKQFSELIFK